VLGCDHARGIENNGLAPPSLGTPEEKRSFPQVYGPRLRLGVIEDGIL